MSKHFNLIVKDQCLIPLWTQILFHNSGAFRVAIIGYDGIGIGEARSITGIHVPGLVEIGSQVVALALYVHVDKQLQVGSYVQYHMIIINVTYTLAAGTVVWRNVNSIMIIIMLTFSSI